MVVRCDVPEQNVGVGQRPLQPQYVAGFLHVAPRLSHASLNIEAATLLVSMYRRVALGVSRLLGAWVSMCTTSTASSRPSEKETTHHVLTEGERTPVFHAVVVRPLTTRSRQDESFFLSVNHCYVVESD